jgi:hypothetical protein
MEFRRVEIRRMIRHFERVTASPEAKVIFDSIMRNCLQFTARVAHVGFLRDCRVAAVTDEAVQIIARNPLKFVVMAKFADVEAIEVESNCDFVAEEKDGAGRWARLILS